MKMGEESSRTVDINVSRVRWNKDTGFQSASSGNDAVAGTRWGPHGIWGAGIESIGVGPLHVDSELVETGGDISSLSAIKGAVDCSTRASAHRAHPVTVLLYADRHATHLSPSIPWTRLSVAAIRAQLVARRVSRLPSCHTIPPLRDEESRRELRSGTTTNYGSPLCSSQLPSSSCSCCRVCG